MKYEIPEFGIIVETFQVPETESTKLHGVICSKLKEHLIDDDPIHSNDVPEAIVDVIESLVLAHACAGIDVASPAYVEGLRSSLEAIANHY